MINCGLLKETITIQKLRTELDAKGNVIEYWTDFCKCHAYANGLNGSEMWEARRENLQETINFIVRYSPKLSKLNTADYRIVWKGKMYDITFIDDYQFRNETLKISAITHGLECDKND